MIKGEFVFDLNKFDLAKLDKKLTVDNFIQKNNTLYSSIGSDIIMDSIIEELYYYGFTTDFIEEYDDAIEVSYQVGEDSEDKDNVVEEQMIVRTKKYHVYK